DQRLAPYRRPCKRRSGRMDRSTVKLRNQTVQSSVLYAEREPWVRADRRPHSTLWFGSGGVRMKFFNRTRRWQWLAVLTLALLVTACGTGAEPPLPTREPAPTFTPTVPAEPTPVDPDVAAAAATQAAQQPVAPDQGAEAPSGEQPPAQEPPAEDPAAQQPNEEATLAAPATETPTPEPTAPAAPEVVINSNMNVRSGPGTNYGIIGAANQGQRYPVTGKNPAGDWWQINYNG